MMTSDEVTSDVVVLPGKLYRIELRTTDPNQEPIILELTSRGFAQVVEAWKALEHRHGHRMDFDAFLVAACDTVEARRLHRYGS